MEGQMVTSAMEKDKARQGLDVCRGGLAVIQGGQSYREDFVKRCLSKDLKEVRGSSLQRSGGRKHASYCDTHRSLA